MYKKKQDITNIDDIKVMVDSFYDKVNQDEALSAIFNGFAQVNWESHLPRMYAFWNKILFAEGDFKGNPFAKHVPLPVKKEHFERWIMLFEENMDELFEGKVADDTKLRARSIAHVFQSKLQYIKSDFNEASIDI